MIVIVELATTAAAKRREVPTASQSRPITADWSQLGCGSVCAFVGPAAKKGARPIVTCDCHYDNLSVTGQLVVSGSFFRFAL